MSPADRRAPVRDRESVSRLKIFAQHAWQRLVEDDGLTAAGVLSYATLLAAVPLTAVVLALFSVSLVFDRVAEDLQNLILRHFVPASGEAVGRYVTSWADQASRLPVLGLVALVVTCVLMIVKVERMLNRVWRVRTPRPWGRRIAVYWLALTAGPLLVGTGLVLSSWVASVPWLRGLTGPSGPARALFGLLPLLITAVGFTLIYVLLPNRRVPWKPAAVGGTVAAVLFEGAKGAFGLYVVRFSSYEAIYGALATGPIFLVWLYVSWVVFLLGASLAAALATFRPAAHLGGFGPRREFVLLTRLAGHLWAAKREGRGVRLRELLEREPEATGEQVSRLMARLEGAAWVRQMDDGRWMLARESDQVSLLDLYGVAPLVLPSAGEVAAGDDDSPWDRSLEAVLAELDEPIARHLGKPLREVFAEVDVSRDAPPPGDPRRS